MSFSCPSHGWQHMLTPCPMCNSDIYQSSSTYIDMGIKTDRDLINDILNRLELIEKRLTD